MSSIISIKNIDSVKACNIFASRSPATSRPHQDRSRPLQDLPRAHRPVKPLSWMLNLNAQLYQLQDFEPVCVSDQVALIFSAFIRYAAVHFLFQCLILSFFFTGWICVVSAPLLY
jgi:hypothetical protein